jgi:catecholate siderophore receptor
MSSAVVSAAERLIRSRLGFVSVAAILCVTGIVKLYAQQGPIGEAKTTQAATIPQSSSTAVQLPTIRVRAARRKPPARRARVAAPAPVSAPAPSTGQAPTFPSRPDTGGAVGYVATQTSTATKTNTPLINVPQSVTVLTKQFIQDQNFQSLNEAVRYVPGVIPHQGEGNRDQVVIRGQSSSADYFVNGIRDDVQYFRDLYNVQRVEVLKGPNAMIFGRGGSGGVINRVLKEADGVPIREITLQGGSFNDKRSALDIGQAITPNLAGRFNAVYENTDSYRDFLHIERYGVNPTVTFLPNDSTRVKLSYEFFHDWRTADRGIPSQVVGNFPYYPYQTSDSTFFGNPDLNFAHVDANIATAVIDHDFDSGVNIKNATRYASYDKMYQNVFPGGPVNAAGTSVNLSAYNHETDRRNLFNQTDLTYKLDSGLVRQTFLVGSELGRQTGLEFRQTGLFNGTSTTLAVSPLNPVSYVPVTFTNLATDSNSNYRLNLAAAYAQDQIEITKYLQIIGGIRFDQFDLSSTDRRTLVTLSRVDNLKSPRLGVVVKPLDNLALYGSYSVSYVPSAGDQFSTLSPGTQVAPPEKLVNKEVGVKWDALPRLQFTSAFYNLIRTNQRLPDPNNPGFFILSGETDTEGFEAGLNGYITDAWQIAGGYAFTDARIASDTSATIKKGNRVGLVPYNTFTLWNRYQFTDLYAAGIGIIHQTDSYASSDDQVVLPGFTRVDGAIFGKIDKRYLAPGVKEMRWQINIENIFGAHYYASADGDNNITPGSPRAIRGSLIANF